MDLRKRTRNKDRRRSKRLKKDRPITSQEEIEYKDANSETSNNCVVRHGDESSSNYILNNENCIGESSSEISDSDDDAESKKVKYMKERVKMDMKRKRILEELNIITLAQDLQSTVGKEKVKQKSKQFQRPTTNQKTVPIRKSLRVLKKEAVSADATHTPTPTGYASVTEYNVTDEEFPLSAVAFEKRDFEIVERAEREQLKKAFKDYDAFINSLKTTPVVKSNAASARVIEDLQMMTLIPENVQKVTKKRVYSMAVHPGSSNLLVAVGDTGGNLGLWKPLLKDSNNGTYMFHASASVIRSLKFSLVNSHKLFMSSHSGQLRCMDLERAVIEEAIVHGTDIPSFDFIGSGHSLIAAHTNGDMVIYDTRESKSLRFYDTRKATGRDGNWLKEIFCVGGHSKTVNAAYFSPVTGNSVLTTCMDDTLREDQVKLRASCRQFNQTGRWLTPFKATWHPECEDIFVVGSMAKPRQIDLYNTYAKKVHTLMNPDVLTTITSVNCFSKGGYLFGGNSSGKVYMFSNIL